MVLAGAQNTVVPARARYTVVLAGAEYIMVPAAWSTVQSGNSRNMIQNGTY